jgi:hypothetical protein
MDIIAIVNKKPAILVVLIGTMGLAASCNSSFIKIIEKPFDKVVADNIESEALGKSVKYLPALTGTRSDGSVILRSCLISIIVFV